jgi:hypothetical protein
LYPSAKPATMVSPSLSAISLHRSDVGIPIIFILAANDDAQKVLNPSSAAQALITTRIFYSRTSSSRNQRDDPMGLLFSAEKVQSQKQRRCTWRREGLVSGAPGVAITGLQFHDLVDTYTQQDVELDKPTPADHRAWHHKGR